MGCGKKRVCCMHGRIPVLYEDEGGERGFYYVQQLPGNLGSRNQIAKPYNQLLLSPPTVGPFVQTSTSVRAQVIGGKLGNASILYRKRR